MSNARWIYLTAALYLCSFVSQAGLLLSTDFTGTRSGNVGVNQLFAISPDGRFAAFGSTASNHVANDTNAVGDAFVHDCLLRRHVWDTTHSLHFPSDSNPRDSYPICFSPDGRHLLFASTATNLVSGFTFTGRSGSQLYMHDLLSNVTTLITVADDGTNLAWGFIPSFYTQRRYISADNRFVSFISGATNLVALTVTNQTYNLYCRDVVLGATEVISLAPSNDRTLPLYTFSYQMSTNGLFFAFENQSAEVVPGMTNTAYTLQVYWRERVHGTNVLVSMTRNGAFAAGHCHLRDMSSDGRYVCFETTASNIVPDQNDFGVNSDLFIRDMFQGEVWLVTRATNGFANGTAEEGQFSANGQLFIYSVRTANLVAAIADLNGSNACDIFAHYVLSRSNAMVSASWQTNSGANAHAHDDFAISPSGRYVLFASYADNLIQGSTSHGQRLYLRDLQAGRSFDPLRTPYLHAVGFNQARLSMSATERYIFFVSQGNYDPFVSDENLSNIDLFRAPLYQPKFISANPLVADALPKSTYILEASFDLLQWSPVQTNTANSQGRVTFPDATSATQRFYRLVWP